MNLPSDTHSETTAVRAKKHRVFLGWASFAFFGAAAIIIAGYCFSVHIARGMDEENRTDLLTRTQTMALLVSGEDIASLTGTSADLASPAYNRLKNTLYDLHDINNGARFIYFMRADNAGDSKLMFLADSESPDSKDYSPPGQVYDQTSPLEMKNYINAVPFTEGPYSDDWGSWVSSYAPIWWQGRLVGIIGMDVSASKWEANDNSFRNIILAITIFAALWFILLGLYIRRTLSCAEKPRV